MVKKKKNEEEDITQYIMGVSKSNYLNNVIGITEACEILGIDNSYLRKLINKGEFANWEYKDIGRIKVFLKTSIQARVGKFKKYNTKK